MTKVVEDGMAVGMFREMEAPKVAVMLFEATIAMIGQRLWSEEPGPWDQDARTLVEVFLYGIASPDAQHERKA